MKNKTTAKKVIEWIENSRDIPTLRKIRVKCRKRIEKLSPKQKEPLDYVSTEKKKEVLKDLFVENER